MYSQSIHIWQVFLYVSLENLVYHVFAYFVVGNEMKIQLNANMLTMYRKLFSGSNVANAVDGDAGDKAHNLDGWLTCVSSTRTATDDEKWLAIALKEVFLISKVRATFRWDTGKGVTVFVGNNPSVIDGRDDYQCGERWIENVIRAPHFHNFTCQPPKWASHVSVQRVEQVIQICEVEVYYTQYTAVGMRLPLQFHHTTTHCSVLCLFCFTQESTFLSHHRSILRRQ